jgi:hypothetical protein
MEYVIVGILVLLLVAGFVTFFVLNATKRSGRAAPSDPGGEGTPAGIAAPDESPLGDTTQHSDATEDEGRSEGAEGDQRPRVGDPGPEATAPDRSR